MKQIIDHGQQVNLVVDAGNTIIKYAVLSPGNVIIEEGKTEKDRINDLVQIISKYQLDKIGFSDVTGIIEQSGVFAESQTPVFRLTSSSPVPLKFDYKSMETLGTDRIAAAVGAHNMFKDTNLLIIQFGTCITMDLVDVKGTFLGGSISPGIEMRLKSMNTFTANLPLVKKKSIGFLTGQNTEQCMLSGAINGCIAETNGIIEKYIENFSPLRTIITGGDAFFFDKKLKNRIFAVKNLVLLGLNNILNYNNDK